MRLRGLGLLLCVSLLVTPAQAQQAPVYDCEQDLLQALQRASTAQALMTQERDAIVRYFQRELTKVQQERDELKQRLAHQRPSQAPDKPAETER